MNECCLHVDKEITKWLTRKKNRIFQLKRSNLSGRLISSYQYSSNINNSFGWIWLILWIEIESEKWNNNLVARRFVRFWASYPGERRLYTLGHRSTPVDSQSNPFRQNTHSILQASPSYCDPASCRTAIWCLQAESRARSRQQWTMCFDFSSRRIIQKHHRFISLSCTFSFLRSSTRIVRASINALKCLYENNGKVLLIRQFSWGEMSFTNKFS